MYCTYAHTYRTIKIYIHLSLYPDIDIDMCSDNNGGCSQICTNTEGSFICECNIGFVLDNDGATCNGEYYVHETYTYVFTNVYVQMHLLPKS